MTLRSHRMQPAMNSATGLKSVLIYSFGYIAVEYRLRNRCVHRIGFEEGFRQFRYWPRLLATLNPLAKAFSLKTR